MITVQAMRKGIRTRRSAGVCAAIVVALVTTAAAGAGKSHAPPTTSGNWSGYAISRAGQSFRDVTGSWTEPAVSCDARASSSASFWVGLGGFAPDATGVEQIGTSADCRNGTPAHYAWFEVLPEPATRVNLAIAPGDQVTAEVSVRGSAVTLWLTDVTSGGVFTTTQEVSQPDLSSAEWIAEAPSLCVSRCRALPLASFGATTFTASSATSGSHTGTITDAAWSAASIHLAPRRHDSAAAAPTALSTDGTSFTVTTATMQPMRRG